MGKKGGKKAKGGKAVAAEPEEEIPEEFRDLTIPQLREKNRSLSIPSEQVCQREKLHAA